jgi:hypothetical protein
LEVEKIVQEDQGRKEEGRIESGKWYGLAQKDYRGVRKKGGLEGGK